MTEIEKMKRYIDRTGGNFPDGTSYQMKINELFALTHMTDGDVAGAICLAFNYGRAKGFRAAQKEARA